jgi:SAM-dependent methyltransferase
MQRIARYDDPTSLGSRLRKKRSLDMIALIDEVHRVNPRSCRIIDMGGTAQYWNVFAEDYLLQRGVKITVVNLPGAGIEGALNPDIFVLAEGNGCNLPYDDDAFDIVHSNSVIEHVGNWDNMVAFVRETRRLAPRYFVQTPNFWFPFEPHYGVPFFHWLPEPVRVSLMLRMDLGQFPKASDMNNAVEFVQDSRLIDYKQFAFLFADAEIHTDKLVGLPKSLVAIRHGRS